MHQICTWNAAILFLPSLLHSNRKPWWKRRTFYQYTTHDRLIQCRRNVGKRRSKCQLSFTKKIQCRGSDNSPYRHGNTPQSVMRCFPPWVRRWVLRSRSGLEYSCQSANDLNDSENGLSCRCFPLLSWLAPNIRQRARERAGWMARKGRERVREMNWMIEWGKSKRERMREKERARERERERERERVREREIERERPES